MISAKLIEVLREHGDKPLYSVLCGGHGHQYYVLSTVPQELWGSGKSVRMSNLLDTLSAAMKVVEAANNVLLLCRRQLRSYYDVDQLAEALAPFSPGEGNDEGK